MSKAMKHFGYKGNGPIGCNNNGLIDPIKGISRRPWDAIGLGFKKVPFHLGINKFIRESKSSSKNESQIESNNPADNSNDEDTFPYPIPLDLSKFFVELDDFVPHVSTIDVDSDSFENTNDTPQIQ